MMPSDDDDADDDDDAEDVAGHKIERDYHLVSHQLRQGSAPVCSYTQMLASSNSRQIQLKYQTNSNTEMKRNGCLQCSQLHDHA